MDVILKDSNVIFIEETVFLADGFYEFLEKLMMNSNHNKLTIYVDRNIHQSIESYKLVSNEKEAYIMEGFIDILEGLNVLKKVETNGYFITNELTSIINQNKTANILILTQKESIFKTFVKIKDQNNHVIIAKYENNEVMEWSATFS